MTPFVFFKSDYRFSPKISFFLLKAGFILYVFSIHLMKNAFNILCTLRFSFDVNFEMFMALKVVSETSHAIWYLRNFLHQSSLNKDQEPKPKAGRLSHLKAN